MIKTFFDFQPKKLSNFFNGRNLATQKFQINKNLGPIKKVVLNKP